MQRSETTWVGRMEKDRRLHVLEGGKLHARRSDKVSSEVCVPDPGKVSVLECGKV